MPLAPGVDVEKSQNLIILEKFCARNPTIDNLTKYAFISHHRNPLIKYRISKWIRRIVMMSVQTQAQQPWRHQVL